jgi:Cyclin, N-terminal domain
MDCFDDQHQTTSSSCSAFDTIAVMRKQEDSAAYQTHDFLAIPSISLIDIDIDCRTKMCAWCYQVADFCKFSRESVEIAMSYLDRFMLTQPHGIDALQSRNTYQLAAMTTLYTAIKIHERQAMSPDVISQLSQGSYSPQQVEAMEAKILDALDWRMNPPTITSFARELLAITGDELSPREHEVAIELTRLQSEVATAAYHLIATPRSVIALAAVTNALESLGTIKRTTLYQMRLTMEQALGNPHQHHNVDTIRSFLYESVTAAPRTVKAPRSSTKLGNESLTGRRTSWQDSPRSVSDHNLSVYSSDSR